MTRKMQIVLGILVILAVAASARKLSHTRALADDSDAASGDSEKAVAAVVRVERGTIEDSLTISGAFKPFQEVDVHAKVAGYIRKIYVDVGDHVREGQLLAILEVPELAAELAGADAAVRRAEQEIHRAQGDLERAKSSHAAAHAMYDRLKQAAEQRAGLVAQQEVDDAQAKDLEAEAGVSSAEASLSAAQHAREVAEANQRQYAALSNYTRIAAPFAGVIAARYADTGALIAAGTTSSSQSAPVVRLVEVSKLRLVLQVPESVAGQIHLGDQVQVHVQALNQDILGKVSRFAGSLELQTRTMETEIDFKNTDEKLLPGMYAETVLRLAQPNDVLVIPVEAVAHLRGEATVLVVNSQHIVEERRITTGLEGKTQMQVLAGLREGEEVILGNQSQFRKGEKVVSQETKLPEMENGGTR